MTDWDTVALAEVADLTGGHAFKSSEYSETGMPVLRTLNIRDDCSVDLTDSKFIPDGLVSTYKRFALHKNDTLFVMVGATLGKVGLVRSKNLPAVLNQNMWRIRAKAGKVDPIYLHYCFRHFCIGPLEWMSGSARGFVKRDDYRALEIPLPTEPEQQQIAAILGALDDKIELNRRMTATLEEMARALYQSWFVDFAPVHARALGQPPAHMDATTAALFPDSFGEDGLPEGWKAGTLGNIAKNVRRQVQPREIDSDTPYIGLEHMPRRCIALSDWGDAGQVGSAKSAMRRGQILFGKLRPYFHKVGIVPTDGICSTDIVVLDAKAGCWRELMLCIVSSDEFIEHTNASSAGTRMPRTNWKDMASYDIVVSPEKVANAFSDIVRPMTEKIGSCVHEARALGALRDTLLPRLMSGELRIRDAEKQVKEVV